MGDEAVPIVDGTAHTAYMHEVKVLRRRIYPIGFGVVDVEFHVGGNPGGLDGREVGAYDFRPRKFVAKIDGLEEVYSA